MYARLYLSVLIGRVRPSETMLQWPRMKRSLDELVPRYPGAVDGNVVASLGCSYADAEYFKTALQKLEASPATSSGWLAGTDPATCKARLLASNAAAS